MSLDDIINTAIEFSKIGSVCGFEEEFRNYLEDKIKDLGYETEISEDGLLIVKTNSENPNNHYTCAHIDRSGLVYSNEKLTYAIHDLKDEKGISAKPTRRACDKIGDRYVGKKVEIQGEIYTISGYDVFRDENGRNRLEFIIEEDLDIDSKEKIPIYYAKEIEENEDFISGQLDNVLSVAVLYEMLKKGKVNGDVIFSVEEEIGLSATYINNYLKSQGINETNNVLVLDTSPFEKEDYKIGEVCLRNQDSKSEYEKNKTQLLEEICKELNINYQFKDVLQYQKGLVTRKEDGDLRGYGLTELGRLISKSEGKYTGTSLQISLFGEGVDESTHKENIDNFVKVLTEYYKKVKNT